MHNWTMTEAIQNLDNVVAQNEKVKVTYINADCLNKAFTDSEYLNVIQSSERIFPDGIGVKIAAKMTKQEMVDNINGTDMFPELCQLAQERDYSIFFLGAKPGTTDAMINNLKERFPNLNIAGHQHGYFDQKDTQQVIDNINQSKANFLFVAMGAPAQEKWINKNAEQLNCNVMLAVGGLFDFNSGNIPRAPMIFRKIGMEWVWRLLQEPGRMWRRYIIGNPLFLYRVFRHGKTMPKH